MPHPAAVPMPTPEDGVSQPVPSAWRPILAAVVDRFAVGDFGLAQSVAGVAPIPANLADDIRAIVELTGERLAPLPPEAWERASAEWYSDRWIVLVDLWTTSGPSDLVMAGRMDETAAGLQFTVEIVHTP
ncbi:hypothetical protein [Xylophilus sp. Leaf220]|uniref:DUF7668 domain-containing protein n=1 Tax=Xylophilus sp. Leaf220 TaxID=1735686 RepID=UPI0012E298B3|nr:hypothetical protein [Xylophilus sp. Leaf220]